MINRKLYIYIAIVFAFLVGACPKTSTTPARYSFAFSMESHKVAYKVNGTYTGAVVEKNKPSGDARDITYTSNKDAIATVDDKGVVTFKTAGTLTITATKEKKDGHDKVTDSYILYITMKPANKAQLFAEIKRAVDAHGNGVNLNYIDVSGIRDMSDLFKSSDYNFREFNGDISGWDVSQVINMESMFSAAESFNQDISKWDVSQVTSMKNMFSDSHAFNQDISKWDVSKVTDMWGMFGAAEAFNQDISDWEVRQVTNMQSMFSGALAFNQDISEWDVSKVTNMRSMFSTASKFNQDISEWDVSQVADMSYMFYNAISFKQNLDAWRTKINSVIKAESWKKAGSMFRESGLADSLPSWCEGDRDCEGNQE